ncbi:MAG: four helix bundle protein [Bacteroidales bacterium]|nr:four helix bundle protein [Bacteroidales bacterium]
MLRFENLEIWQNAIVLSDDLFDIAEGSGSFSDKEFAYFLNIARRSVFECANILIIFQRRNLINEKVKSDLLDRLDILSRKITNFRKSLII